MAAIAASFSFTPVLPGGNIVVAGDSLSELKQKVKAQIEIKRQAAQGQVSALDAADAVLDA